MGCPTPGSALLDLVVRVGSGWVGSVGCAGRSARSARTGILGVVERLQAVGPLVLEGGREGALGPLMGGGAGGTLVWSQALLIFLLEGLGVHLGEVWSPQVPVLGPLESLQAVGVLLLFFSSSPPGKGGTGVEPLVVIGTGHWLGGCPVFTPSGLVVVGVEVDWLPLSWGWGALVVWDPGGGGVGRGLVSWGGGRCGLAAQVSAPILLTSCFLPLKSCCLTLSPTSTVSLGSRLAPHSPLELSTTSQFVASISTDSATILSRGFLKVLRISNLKGGGAGRSVCLSMWCLARGFLGHPLLAPLSCSAALWCAERLLSPI